MRHVVNSVLKRIIPALSQDSFKKRGGVGGGGGAVFKLADA